MYFNNIDFTVVYIDPSIATAGDGTSPLTALKDFPSSISDNTCYLIRRTAYASKASLPLVETSANNLMIIGMPKAEDEIYYLMPEEAKTAWGSDTEDYANIYEKTDGRLYLTSSLIFIAHRLFVIRLDQNHYDYLFNFIKGDEDYTGYISFTNCRFSAINRDIASDSNTTVFDNTTSCSAYIGVNSTRTFIFRDNYIDFSADTNNSYFRRQPDYDNYSRCGVIVRRCADFIDYSNNEIHVTTCGQYNYYRGVILGFINSNQYTRPRVIANNIKYTIYKHINKQYIPRLFATDYMYYCELNNLNVSFSKLKTFGTITNNNFYAYSTIINVSRLAEFKISNINLDMRPMWHVGNNTILLNIMYDNLSTFPGYQRIIKDITITLAETTEDNESIGNSYSELDFEDFNSSYFYYNAALRICGGGDGGNSYTNPDNNGDSQYRNRMSEPVIITGLTINALRGVAIAADGVQITDANIRGACRFKCCIVNLDKLESFYPGKILYCIWNTTCYIGELITCVDNADGMSNTDDVICSGVSNRQHIYIGKCNKRLKDITQSTSSQDNKYTIICGSEINDGHFTQRTGNINCETWNVNRTGGASACLKFWSNAYNTTNALFLGDVPFKGRVIDVLEAGAYVLKVYVAFKAFTDNPDIYGLSSLYERIRVTVRATKNSTTNNFYNSTLHGRWTKDTTSVWNNDSELQQAVLEIPIKVESVGSVDVSIAYSYYDPTGYFYIDPDFELVKITQ